MNDISDITNLSDSAILKEIGEFVKVKRINQNLRQAEVADQAAISRSTLSLLERGDNIALSNLLKVLRVLDALYVFDRFRVTEPILSPIQLAKEDEKKRKRASRNVKKNVEDNQTW